MIRVCKNPEAVAAEIQFGDNSVKLEIDYMGFEPTRWGKNKYMAPQSALNATYV